jgi:hypothetical protein
MPALGIMAISVMMSVSGMAQTRVDAEQVNAGLAAGLIPGLTAGPTSGLIVGPAYTGIDGGSTPKFPDIDLVFELNGPDGAPVTVRAGDLKLFSQGQEIGTANSIRAFGQTGYGITSILALDVNSSINGEQFDAIHASVARFVGQARPQDRVAVLTLADKAQVDVPFGAGEAALASALQNVKPHGDVARLYDGLLDALALFPTAQPRRRQLLVISDGQDAGSAHTLAEVIVRAKLMGVVVDSIELAGKDREDSLMALAQETGGSFVRAQSARDLEALIGHGIEATRATPVAAFHLSHLDPDDKVHAMVLRWQASGQVSSLSAPAFLKTPKSGLLRSLIPNRVSDLWTWALGGCFVAGLILLVLSWRGGRSRAVSNLAAGPGSGFAAAPVERFTPQVSDFAARSVPSVARIGAPVRTPTLAENERSAKKYPPALPAGFDAAHDSSSLQRDMTLIERNTAQMAAFFGAPAGGPFARLQITSGNLAGRTIPVTTTNFTIGAANGNSLLLPGDLTISGEHMRLLWENSVLKIEDRKSTNGTYVNAQRLLPGRHLLKPGDEIRIGRAVLVVGKA